MVELIPDVIAPEIKSQAEKDLFLSFKSHVTDQKYVVLHSLGVAEHCNNIFGEIDFVVICRQGVLCIEVKGGKVSRSAGIWEFTNRYGKVTQKNEGPFQQVQGNMHSLRAYLKDRLGEYDPLVRCQYASAVVIPEDSFTAQGIDIIPEILFDNQYDWDLSTMVDKAFSYWREQCLEKHCFAGATLSDREIDRMAVLLRGDFHFIPSLKISVDRTAKELCTLTEQQYEIMEALEDNPRLLISGVAGAGKTLLAVEQARRAYWEGKKVLYLCFNHSILQYISYIFEKEQLDIEASTLHSLMMRECGLSWDPDFGTDFFKQILPQKFLNLKKCTEYDVVIIDEAQDLLTSTYIRCIERFLKGGLGAGRWLIFYDPNQNIFNANGELLDITNYLRLMSTSFNLSRNCRNTQQIAAANTLMTNIPNQGKTLTSGMQVQYISYYSKENEWEKLNTVIQKLRNDGVTGSDFIILSKYSLTNPQNVISQRVFPDEVGTLKLSGPIWKAKKSEIRFSTISGFKGLDAKIVILIDVDKFSDEDTRLLNYVAISRACALLYVIYDDKAEDDRQNMILSGYMKI